MNNTKAGEVYGLKRKIMEELLNKLFDRLEELKMYSPVYAYEVKMTNQIIRSFFEEELSKLHQPSDCNTDIPAIGTSYSIMENGKRIQGKVISHQNNAGKFQFWVKWDDGGITREDKMDRRR